MRLPTPVVLFDAVDTLIRPNPPAAQVYHRLGQRYGSRLDSAQVRQGLEKARRRFFGPGIEPVDLRRVNQPTDEASERQRWRQVVASVFDDLPDTDRLFHALWSHFQFAENWTLLSGAADCWQRLRRRGLVLGLATNFDIRFRAICQALEPLCDADHVLISSELGFSKPDPRFFRSAQKQIGMAPDQILMVGDDRINDFLAPRYCGWQAVRIDRTAPAGDLQAVRSLDDLT